MISTLQNKIGFKVRCIVLVAFFPSLFVGQKVYAQDPQFSQFYSTPMLLAPSFAGGVRDSRLSLNFRDQWASIPGKYVTYSASYDRNFPLFNSGVGFYFMRDVAGSSKLSLTNLGFAYSYLINLSSEWHFRPGVGVYFTERSIDYTKLVFGDQLTSGSPTSTNPYPGKESINDVDASSSLLFFNSVLWTGVTVDHLLEPNRAFTENSARTPLRISAYGGMRIVIRGLQYKPADESVSVAFHYKQQGDFRQFDAGIYWYRKPLLAGVWYRGIPFIKSYPGSDAIVFMVGYRMDGLQIGYSYDATVSKLGFQTGGTHELSVIYEFSITAKKKWAAIPCPEF